LSIGKPAIQKGHLPPRPRRQGKRMRAGTDAFFLFILPRPRGAFHTRKSAENRRFHELRYAAMPWNLWEKIIKENFIYCSRTLLLLFDSFLFFLAQFSPHVVPR
jgi:hypothetical protein